MEQGGLHQVAGSGVGSAVDQPGQGGQQEVAPVGAGAVVEMGGAEDERGHPQGQGGAADLLFQEVLNDAPEQQLLGNGDEYKYPERRVGDVVELLE